MNLTSFIATLMIITINLVVVFTFKDHIQLALNITGGLFGVTVMMLLPSLLVIFGRIKVESLIKNEVGS